MLNKGKCFANFKTKKGEMYKQPGYKDIFPKKSLIDCLNTLKLTKYTDTAYNTTHGHNTLTQDTNTTHRHNTLMQDTDTEHTNIAHCSNTLTQHTSISHSFNTPTQHTVL